MDLIEHDGDFDWLIGSPVISAETVDSGDRDAMYDRNQGCYTWTYYKISTIKGSVTLRFYGTSNGYYSQDVNLMRVVENTQ